MNNRHIINTYRRALMRRLTGSVGAPHTTVKHGEQPGFKRILVIRPNNRLGNLLLITPLLQELEETFPGCTIDVFVRGGLAPVLFKNYPKLDRVIMLPGKPFKQLVSYAAAWLKLKGRRYDLAINVIPESSSGRLATKFSNSRHKVFGNVKAEVADRHVARMAVHNLREFVALFGMDRSHAAIPSPGIKLSASEIAEGKKLLHGFAPSGFPVISIFTYATAEKLLPAEWWEDFYERLQQEFPAHEIVEVLPAENVSQIGFQAPAFYSRDIRQIAALIANTSVFIGADSGMMHLANASGTPTVGLFSVTDPERYTPYGNNSTAVDINKTDIDGLIGTIRKSMANQ